LKEQQMAIVRRQPVPVICADSATVLNPDLSPTARLLYVVMLAIGDVDDTDRLARLVGAEDVEALSPVLDELVNVGAVTVTDHGYGPAATVHQVPVPPESRVHPCMACADCGECACADSGYPGPTQGVQCYPCGHKWAVRETAQRDIARWKGELDAGATYAIGQHSTLLHRWDCQSLNTVERGLALLEQRAAGDGSQFFWQRLPSLYTAHELRLREKRPRSCQNCKPDPL
jgi:hypothetical protein